METNKKNSNDQRHQLHTGRRNSRQEQQSHSNRKNNSSSQENSGDKYLSNGYLDDRERYDDAEL